MLVLFSSSTQRKRHILGSLKIAACVYFCHIQNVSMLLNMNAQHYSCAHASSPGDVSVSLADSHTEAASGKGPPVSHCNFICLLMVLPREERF